MTFVTSGDPSSKRTKPARAMPSTSLTIQRLITQTSLSFRMSEELAGEHGELFDPECARGQDERDDASEHGRSDPGGEGQAPLVGDTDRHHDDDAGHDRGGRGNAKDRRAR